MRKKTLEHQWLEAAECRRRPDIRAGGAVVLVNEHLELETKSPALDRVVTHNRIRKYLMEVEGAAVYEMCELRVL
ncbi:hypothetical protein [Salinicoccus carnicancri]|uniref:hypothetical protein n=1 Tax=Salinicoccus carnicancri TaxID=558170 RepID=UPI00031C40E9|nr:hypothetical protein [Salinicoccus carnicancri]